MSGPPPTADRAALEAGQLASLQRLIGRVRASNRFYGPRLEAAGLDETIGSLSAFAANLPVTRKGELADDQQRHPPYGTNLTEPVERYCRYNQTSGTTAAPLRWLDTAGDWQAMLECWKRVFSAAGVDETDRVVFAFSFGPFLGFWTAFEAATQLHCLSIPAGGMSSAARLRLLLDNRATVLCCTPTYALRLAEIAEQEGIRLRDTAVRTIVVAGEPGGSVPAMRRQVTERWHGARLFDHHGMTEVGPVTYEQPGRPGLLRVMEDAFLAEVIDPQTQAPVEPGETGELVLTTLHRPGMPLLRYRTGDLVRPVYVDDAGRDGGPHLALDGGILGRADDMAVVRGVNVHPTAVDQVLRARPEIAEYRVTVRRAGSMQELAIEIEPTPETSDPQELARDVQDEFRLALNLRVSVETVEPGALPRFEMKAKRWVREDGPRG